MGFGVMYDMSPTPEASFLYCSRHAAGAGSGSVLHKFSVSEGGESKGVVSRKCVVDDPNEKLSLSSNEFRFVRNGSSRHARSAGRDAKPGGYS